jgi:hypothetical protein
MYLAAMPPRYAAASLLLPLAIAACERPAAPQPGNPQVSTTTASPPSAASASTPTPDAPLSPAAARIDEAFRGFRDVLPPAATLSEQNGASTTCPHHGGVTYTRLGGTASRLPVESDADVVALVPWTRDPDLCLRQIAIEAILARVERKPGGQSLPDMHEPDSVEFHEILRRTRVWLQRKGIAAPPRVFAGMGFDARPADLLPRAQGRWQEDMTGRNFGTWLEVTATELRVTSHHARPDPVWPDRTWTTPLGAVRVDEQDAFVIEGEGVEVAAGRPDGSPQKRTYLLLPTGPDVLWVGTPTPGQQPRWTRLRRVAASP